MTHRPPAPFHHFATLCVISHPPDTHPVGSYLPKFWLCEQYKEHLPPAKTNPFEILPFTWQGCGVSKICVNIITDLMN